MHTKWLFRDIYTKVYVFKKEMDILKIPLLFESRLSMNVIGDFCCTTQLPF